MTVACGLGKLLVVQTLTIYHIAVAHLHAAKVRDPFDVQIGYRAIKSISHHRRFDWFGLKWNERLVFARITHNSLLYMISIYKYLCGVMESAM